MQERIHNLLQQAVSAQQQGDLKTAENACREILVLDANQPDALHFIGLIEETRGNFTEARTLLQKSLAANPQQPHVLNNLGNRLHADGESTEALELIKRAVAMAPEYWVAWFNLGKIYFDTDDLDAAEKVLIKARDNWTGAEPLPHSLLGNLYQKKDKFAEADENFKAALQLNPKHFYVLHNYGLSLKLQQKSAEALILYQKALDIRQDVPELFYNIANACFDVGDIEGSIANYQKAIALDPHFSEAHFALNEVLWRAGKKEQYASSYREAAKKGPLSIELQTQFLDNLIKAQRFDEAEEVLAPVLKEDQNNPELWYLHAKVQSAKGQSLDTMAALEKSILLAPKDVVYRKDLAKIFIKIGDIKKALKVIEEAHAISPMDQEILAYLALCWRLNGNPKGDWLNNFENFIRGYTIPTPPGYASLGEFNAALNKALDNFHTTIEQPSDQTLRGGTQSVAELLDKNVPEIQEARVAFEEIIARYISELPDDPKHPLLSRKSNDFTFAGSWSVRLKGEGFHVNHTHPDGWLSSCYYVNLPDTVKTGEDQQGWIKFGESPLDLGAAEVIGKTVQPREGLLVLFPSYMFHGTIPFQSDETRTTLPFDVIPL